MSNPHSRKKFITAGLIETFICAGLVWFISVWFQNFSYIITWSILGWSQLLRTRKSTRLALFWFAPIHRVLSGFLKDAIALIGKFHWSFGNCKRVFSVGYFKKTRLGSVLQKPEGPEFKLALPFKFWMAGLVWLPVLYLLVALLAFLSLLLLFLIVTAALGITLSAGFVRFAATVLSAIFYPAMALKAVPRNWRRVTWGMEILAPLDFVPRHRLMLSSRRRRERKSSENGALEGYVFSPTKLPTRQMITRTTVALASVILLILIPVTVHRPNKIHSLSEHNIFFDDLNEYQVSNYDLFSLSSPLAVAKLSSDRVGSSQQFNGLLSYAFPLIQPAILCIIFLLYATYLAACVAVILFCLSTPLRLVLFLPGLMYRFSLKASALTYTPLFFVGEAPFAKFTDVRLAFMKEQEAPWPAVQRFLAKLSAFMLLVSALAATLWSTMANHLPAPIAAILKPWFLFLYPSHLATASTILLTFGIWFMTKNTLWQEKQGRPVSFESPGKWVLTMQRLRSVLSIYTMLWSIYWAATSLRPALREIHAPVIRWVVLPWNS